MTPIEMAEAMEGRARVRRKITNRENLGDRLSDQLEQAAAMLRDQHLRIQQLEQTQEYLFKKHDADKAEIASLKKEAALQRLSDFTQEAEALKAHPVKELHLSLQKSKQTGELLAVTYTDDEHRIVEVLWQKPPALTEEEILEIWKEFDNKDADDWFIAITRAILRKAQEK